MGRSRATVQAEPRKTPSRLRLLDVAEELFAQRGFAGVGMAEVAERAGLGKASLFHHFPSKAQLYCAVLARVLTSLEVDLVRALADGGTPAQRLDRWVDTVIDVLVAHPTYPRLLLRVLVEDDDLPKGLAEGKEANDAIRRIGASAIRLLQEGMESGEFHRASPAHTLQALIGATVHPMATGRFGDELIGESLFSPAQVRRRKATLRALIHTGIVTDKEGTRS